MIALKRGIVPAAFACLLLAAAAPAQADMDYVTTTHTYVAPTVIHQGMMGMGHAQSIALMVEPGRVERAALVRDRYGEPVYVFDIRNGDALYGVGIDATTGEVVENLREDVRIRQSNFWDRLLAPMNSGD